MRAGLRGFRLPPMFDATGLAAERRRTLLLIMLGMAFGSAFTMITTGAPFAGFTKHLGISDLGLSVLAALPALGGATQLAASSIIERRHNRRAITLTFGFAARLLWLGVGLTPLLVPGEHDYRLMTLLMLCSASAVCGAFLNVSFLSLLADLVPLNIRGRYLAARSRAGLIAAFIASFVTGWLLDVLPPDTGYLVVFVLAALLGCADIVIFFFTEWPPMQQAGDAGFGAVLRRALCDKKFIGICGFWTLWYFSSRIANPFWSVHMLTTLGMTYRQISLLCTMLYNLFSILMIGRWGRVIDRYGTYACAKITCLLIALIPIPYIVATPSTYWLVAIGEMLSGFAWSGNELTAMNMYLGASPQEGRSVYIAVYMLGTQLIGNALAFITGGWLVDNVMPLVERLTLPWVTTTRHTGIFALTLVLRLAAVLFLLPRIKPEGTPPLLRAFRQSRR